ncbi:MAG TPA: CoA pyrophosphatase [Aestuariivirga sp.]
MFSFDDFLMRAEKQLLREPPEGWNHSDDDMNERARMIPVGMKPNPAAVLIGIVERDEPMVILTRRQDTLAKHAGQIAFPGGRLDEDEGVLAGALREAKEEIGLDRALVRPIGYLDGFLTVTQYVVNPVVALVSPLCVLAAHAGEVAEIFEVPLAFLMDGANCQTHTRAFNGLTRHFYVYPFGERYIWGATAGMIRNLHERLYA